MEGKIFETILGTGTHEGHTYEVHQFIKWFGYVPYFAIGKNYPPYNDWYLVKVTKRGYNNIGALRYRDPNLEAARLKTEKEDNIFYEHDKTIGYQVYCDGNPLANAPTVGRYCLPEGVKINPVNDWQSYRRGNFKRTFEDPVKIWDCDEYNKFFTPKYNIGDTVFCVTYHDRETRCGERYQVEHMKIEAIAINMGDIIYSNTNEDFFTIDDIHAHERNVALTVEELIKRYEGKQLYMWRRTGSSYPAIEPVHSTMQYKNAWMR